MGLIAYWQPIIPPLSWLDPQVIMLNLVEGWDFVYFLMPRSRLTMLLSNLVFSALPSLTGMFIMAMVPKQLSKTIPNWLIVLCISLPAIPVLAKRQNVANTIMC